ncbi:MAG: DNA polymerase III subunit epsilon [Betaproteobacteria bacterium]|nr:DNA polymerase III subunit epsilon [Betaproteobacteria bacterium]
MTRQIFLDTETTGLEPRLGHRIIEIAAVEMVNRRLTGRYFHRYLNPEREIDAGAEAVHGLSSAFLQDKPKFADVVDEFLQFISLDELVIHNAAFDIGFLRHELGLLDRAGQLEQNPVLDTLRMARELHPGQKNNLDALCRRYEVDNASRTLHGALLDAELLAAVYLGMTRGQDSLMIGMETPGGEAGEMQEPLLVQPRILPASAEELQAHHSVVRAIGKSSRGACFLW